MLEGVLEIGKQLRLVEKLRGLEVGEIFSKGGLRQVCDGVEERERHVLADDRSGLEQLLLFGREPVDARREHGLDGRGYSNRHVALAEVVGAWPAHQQPSLYERPHALLKEEWIPLGVGDEMLLERLQSGILAKEGVEEFARALRRQGIEAKLIVVRLTGPAVPVFGAAVDQQKHARCWQALDQAVKERLCLGVDPMEVLED